MSNHFGHNAFDDSEDREHSMMNAEEEEAQQGEWELQDAIMRSSQEAARIGLGSVDGTIRSIEAANLKLLALDSFRETNRTRSAAETAEAFSDALSQTRRRITSVAESNSQKILKKKSGSVMDDVKVHIKKAREKERMRTVSYFLCDRCDKPILNPEGGFIVQGNVYVADASCRGGLIGSAFPEPAEDGSNLIDIKDIQEVVFCKECLLSALGINSVTTRKSKVKPVADTSNVWRWNDEDDDEDNGHD